VSPKRFPRLEREICRPGNRILALRRRRTARRRIAPALSPATPLRADSMAHECDFSRVNVRIAGQMVPVVRLLALALWANRVDVKMTRL
jgi:hypothetical protein